MLNTGLMPLDPLLMGVIQNYQTCRMGTGGMGFNYEHGSWGDTPMWLLTCYQILDNTVAEHAEKQREAKQVQHQASRNPAEAQQHWSAYFKPQ